MNRKEIAEIRKLYSHDRCSADKICGCYVDGNKNKVTTFKQTFLTLPDEEIFKYLTIFRKSLGGTIGKNLMNMDFPLDTEGEGGSHELLMKLRESGLDDDELLDLFYDKVIDNYEYGENYLILLIHNRYDVPAKGTDDMLQEDASEYVYDHMICSICPVNLSKEGLCYNALTNAIENRTRDWWVEAPQHAFLFPAFNDRNTDIHGMLYFAHKAEELQADFIGGMFGCVAPMTSKSQKATFNELLTESLGEDCRFETVKSIHENLADYVEEHKEDPEPVTFAKEAVSRVLEASEVEPEQVERFAENYEETVGRNTLMAGNIVNTRTFKVETPDVEIKVAAGHTDLIKTKEIDGVSCLVIQITDSVEVNGIPVRP